jgi:hypothetical protein
MTALLMLRHVASQQNTNATIPEQSGTSPHSKYPGPTHRHTGCLSPAFTWHRYVRQGALFQLAGAFGSAPGYPLLVYA